MSFDNLGQFITHLAKKAGVDASDPDLINILSSAEVANKSLPAELARKIDENLLSIDGALGNHPRVKSHYHAQALNGMDKKMEEIMTESSLPEEKVQELKAITSTYARFEALSAALKEHATAKVKGQTQEDKSALQKQVDELLTKLRDADANKQTEIQTIQQQRQQDRIRYELRAMLGGVKTIWDDLPSDVKQASMDALINKALQDKNAVLTFNENDVFDIQTKDGASVVGANHTRYTPQSFIDEILAQNKVLKVTPAAATTGTAGSTPQTGTTVTAAQTGPKGNNQTIANLNMQRLQQAQANQTQ